MHVMMLETKPHRMRATNAPLTLSDQLDARHEYALVPVTDF
jgi:hypothetical protein